MHVILYKRHKASCAHKSSKFYRRCHSNDHAPRAKTRLGAVAPLFDRAAERNWTRLRAILVEEIS